MALRLLLILSVAIAAHIAVLLVLASSGWLLGSRLGSIAKARTFTRFLASVAVFIIWFAAVGFALTTIGVPLQTYIASATIIGLAVSFGSQSLVQDVISGLTLIFTGLIDVGDMVDISGQVGIVEKIGIRYTELRNVQGAAVSIPNRNVTNVISYKLGYIRAFLDVHLPGGGDTAQHEEIVRQLTSAANATFDQFSGIMIRRPSLILPEQSEYIRIKFRIWPGQGGIVEGPVRQRLIASMRALDPSYQDWMVAVHYRVEPAFLRRAASSMNIFRRRRRATVNLPPAGAPHTASGSAQSDRS